MPRSRFRLLQPLLASSPLSGNGLSLLKLHAESQDEHVLAEATRFALFACLPACAEGAQVKKALLAEPDRPHSLFEVL